MWVALIMTLFAVTAMVNWRAVATANRRVEVAAKPLTLAILIVVALLIDPTSGSPRTLIVVGLTLSLIGDVFLLADSPKTFLGGLVTFLAGHIAYIAAFVAVGISIQRSIIGAVVVGLGVVTVGIRIVKGMQSTEPAMTIPVVAYMAVISMMVIAAFGSGLWIGAGGAVLFYLSDAAIAWTRFVRDERHGRLFVMVTYHLAQLLIVVSIV